jgi:hypothetical protein
MSAARPFVRSLARTFDQMERSALTTFDMVFITNRVVGRRWRQPRLLIHGALGRISTLPATSCRAAITAPALGSAKPGNPAPASTCWSLLTSAPYPGAFGGL